MGFEFTVPSKPEDLLLDDCDSEVRVCRKFDLPPEELNDLASSESSDSHVS